MKNIRFFLFENFQFLEVEFSIYSNRNDLVMKLNKKTTNRTKYEEKKKEKGITQSAARLDYEQRSNTRTIVLDRSVGNNY